MKLIEKQKTSTTLGCLSKAWYSDSKTMYLVKGNLKLNSGGYGWEPYSEAIVSVIASVLNIPHIHYTLAPADEFPDVKTYEIPVVSICKKYNIPKGCQKLSALAYMEAFHRREINTNYWSLFKRLPIDKASTFDMLVLDAIVGNKDRHLNNWEYIITEDSVSLMPIFDFGESLLAQNTRLSRCVTEKGIGTDKAKPFKDTHSEQMRLIKKYYPTYQFSRDAQVCWKAIEKGIIPILKSIPDDSRASKIYTYLHNRFFFYLQLMG